MSNKQLVSKFFLPSVFLLAFSSGLPLTLTSSTLQAWLTTADVSLKTLGWTTLLGAPYLFKFLWAPLLDHYPLTPLGRRRSWILLSQLLLATGLIALSFLHVPQQLNLIFLVCIFIALMSATQDIAIDAHRSELLTVTQEFAKGNVLYSLGYRIAMLVAGAGSLILADHIGFMWVYRILGIFFLILTLVTFSSPEPAYQPLKTYSFSETFIDPIRELHSRPQFWLLLLFIPLYKCGDAAALSLATAFYLKELKFSLTDVGTITKTVGLLGSLTGIFLGGWLIERWGQYRTLVYGGIIQCISIACFGILAWVGHNYGMLVTAILVEQLCSGIGTAAFMVTSINLSHPRYVASQYAFFSALASIARVVIGPWASTIAEHYGWFQFFLWSMMLCIPGILLLIPLKPTLSKASPKAT